MDLGEVVIRLDGTGNRFRHTDFRGNVLFVSKGAGTAEGFASYRGFGTQTVSGQLGERGFAGGFEIPSLGLVVLGPRVLDSDTGRFLSQDPVFNAVNQYAYAQGNPVMMWDPAGNDSNVYSAVGNVSAASGWAAAIGIAGLPHGLALGPFFANSFRAGTVHFAHLVWSIFDEAAPEPTFTDLMGVYGTGFSGFQGGGGSASGGSSAGGGIQNGAGNPPGPDSPNWGEMHPEIYIYKDLRIEVCPGKCPGGSPMGNVGGVYGLGSLNFSIAVSFAGASW